MFHRSGLAAVMGVATVACVADPVERTGVSQSALSTLGVFVNLPTSGYVGVPLNLTASLFNTDGATHNDVTMRATITGKVTAGKVQPFGQGFVCAVDSATAASTVVTCHADVVMKDGFTLPLTPTGEGTITVDTELSEGGVVLASARNTSSIVVGSGADLMVFTSGGETVPLGSLAFVGFYAASAGPLPAPYAKLDLALAGAGKIVGVSSWALPPDSCTFTDTTATCALGELTPNWPLGVDVLVEGGDVGVVAVTGRVSSDATDPVPGNNSATHSFAFVRPRVADVALTMTATPDPASFNKPLTYTMVVTNKGPDASGAVYLNDFLPSVVSFKSVATTKGACFGGDSGYLFCDLGGLASGASATVTLVTLPTEGGTIVSSASVYTPPDELDPDPSNNYATVSTTVRGPTTPVETTSTQQRFNGELFVYVPCANDFVALTGTLHSMFHTTFNKTSGRAQFDVSTNPQGMQGTAMASGVVYEATGVTRRSHKFVGGFPASFTYQNNFRLIGRAKAVNLLVHTTEHVTFGPDGTPRVNIAKTSVECR